MGILPIRNTELYTKRIREIFYNIAQYLTTIWGKEKKSSENRILFHD